MMVAETGEKAKDQRDRIDAANEQIRSTVKWLIAAAAAVGAALIAGSQFSSIGKLDACSVPAFSTQCLRLPLALIGTAIAFFSVVYIIWQAAQILVPIAVTINELQEHWENDKKWADGKFFKANPQYLSYSSPADLEAARKAAWDAKFYAEEEVNGAKDAERPAKEKAAQFAAAEFERVQGVARDVAAMASYQLVQASFSKLLVKLLVASLLTAAGLVTFAWAANPPTPASSTNSLKGSILRNADLRDTNLDGIDLRDADLSGANLQGANLTDTRVDGVKWVKTTCPDGTNSDGNGGTCRGHLSAYGIRR